MVFTIPDYCEDAAEYYHSSAIKVVEGLHIVACTLSIIFSILFYYNCHSYFYFHKNSKILMIFLLVVNVFHGIFLGSTQIYHFYEYFTARSSCDVLVSNTLCFFLRFPAHMSMTLFIYAQAAIAVERSIGVCFSKYYEKFRSTLGHALVLIVIVSSFFPSYLFLSKWDLSTYSPYCSNVNIFTYKEMFTFICYYNTIVSLASFLLFLSMRFYNWQLLHQSVLQTFLISNLERRVFRLLSEITFNFVFYVIYAVSNVFSFEVYEWCTTAHQYRVYLAAINTIPYYTVLSPLFMWWILKRSRLQRMTAVVQLTSTRGHELVDTYFGGLEAQWEAGALARKRAFTA